MSTVRALLQKIEQKEIYHVAPSTPVLEAMRLMRQHKIGSILVMEEGHFSGIVTERDVCWKMELEGKTASGTRVEEIMTPDPNVHAVTRFTTLEGCLALMDKYHVRHLPVIEKGEVLGVVSIRDVVRGIVEHQIWLAQQFQGYISSPT